MKFLVAFYNYKISLYYKKQFKNYLIRKNIRNSYVEGEAEYKKFWSVLSNRIESYSYRFFSHYCGKTPYIIPEDIGHTVIERILNPERFRPYYSDKNMYSQYIRKEYLPKTILCRVNGSLIMDENYHPISNEKINSYLSSYNRVILKPSIDSSSGVGVMLFTKYSDGRWFYKKGNVELTCSYLEKYSNDFVLQEAIGQCPYMAQFSSTSVNTLRLTVYRSIKTEEVVVPSAIMRIGREGEFVDNAHAGGVFIGLDPETGMLINDYVMNQYGDKLQKWNSIDYSQQKFQIPNWSKVLELAKSVGASNKHCRLLALDISIDENGMPRLIEYNCNGFSFWLFMYCGETVFGRYTEEVVDYCQRILLKHNGKLTLYIEQR